MHPTVRVYLLCYNRNDVLERALNSLIGQNYKEWICELHCDKPDNDYPGQLVKKINDPRIIYCHHDVNLGLTGAFNVAFKSVEEKYISILEEDNWWELDFLSEAISALENNEDCTLVWSNMRIWNLRDNNWIDTSKNIWELQHNENIKFYFPHIQQIQSALHSQGCMLVKMHPYNPDLITPRDLDSGALEAIRERAFTYPILFLNKKLGNYAMLEETHRPKNKYIWSTIQLCLIISFFINVKVNEELLRSILKKAREGRTKSIHVFLLAKFINHDINIKVTDFEIGDLFFLLAYYSKNYKELKLIIGAYKKLKELRIWLNKNTLNAYLENKNYETCQ